jgi:hypothetical protein
VSTTVISFENNVNQLSFETETVMVISEVATGPQGPSGSSLLTSGLAANLKATGPLTLDWNPAGPAVITAIIIRANSITGVVTPPTISIRRDDNEVFFGPQLLSSLTAGKARHLPTATGPLMAASNEIKIVLNTPANATTFDVFFDVLGYYY